MLAEKYGAVYADLDDAVPSEYYGVHNSRVFGRESQPDFFHFQEEAHRRLDALTARLIPAEDAGAGQQKQHDVEILASLPGVGRIVLATLLAEAWDGLQRRDYAALRSLTGVAPVTKKSGKSCIVIRRQACSNRLANVMYHWARVAIQFDTASKAKYATLRGRGHSHGRALRSVADRLLSVACAMLKNGALFNPSSNAQNTPC